MRFACQAYKRQFYLYEKIKIMLRNKTISLKLSQVIFLLITLVLFASCTVSESLQLKGYDNFKVTNIMSEPQINADITLYNPNKIGATIREMNIALSVDNKEIGVLGFDDKVRIKKRSDFVLPIEFNTSLNQLGGVLSFGLTSFISDKEIPVGLTGSITVQKFIFFRKTFEFNYVDALDVKKIKG